MTDCVIVQPIARPGVALLEKAGLSVFEAPSHDLNTLLPYLRTARAAITRNHGLSAEAIAAAPKLRIIASHGTGTDRIDKAAAEKHGIKVVNTPGANAQSVAEHALALMLNCSRHIRSADEALRNGDWAFRERAHPVEVSGRCLGLVGYGHVARRLAAMAGRLCMRVVVHSAHGSDAELARDGVLRAAGLDALLSEAHIVSLHGMPAAAPVLDETRIGKLRPDAIVINTARGALIDEAALANALRHGRIAAAGLDVFSNEPISPDNPLLDCPNLILTPHMAGTGVEALERTALEVARKVIEGLGLPVPE